jgi:Domain of unknown function (DUF4926)
MTPHRNNISLLDVVALTADLPERSLLRGQVGTVVEVLAPGVFEVEFSDDQGHPYAQLALRDSQLMVLHYRPQQAA